MTVEFLHSLKATEQDTKDAWALEKFPTELENAAALGGMRVVRQAIDLIEGYKEIELAPGEGKVSHVS